MSDKENIFTEKQSFEKFGQQFQQNLCQIVLDDRIFCDMFAEVIDIAFFEVKYLRLFVQKIFEYRKKYNTHPSRDIMTMILRAEIDKEDELVQKQVREYFARVEANTFSIEGEQHIKDVALDFCKKQKLKEALIKSVELIKSSSFDEVAKVINDATKLGTDNNFGYDYVVDFEKRYQLITRNAISTGWELIDKITQGGLGRGELAVVVAASGNGKSMHLVHLAAKALEQGKNVVYYTLELRDTVVASRFDSCITGIPINDLPNLKDKVLETVKNIQGKLIVKEYPTKSASVSTIKNHIEKLKRSGFNPDMIIIDYADLLRASGGVRTDEKRHQLEGIYEDLRGMAQFYQVAVATASQTNRSGISAEVITMESISEAYNKCFVADFIYSVSRTIKDKECNEGRIYIAKNRNGVDGIVFPLFMDTSCVKIKVMQQTDETATDIINKGTQNQQKLLQDKYKDWKNGK